MPNILGDNKLFSSMVLKRMLTVKATETQNIFYKSMKLIKIKEKCKKEAHPATGIY